MRKALAEMPYHWPPAFNTYLLNIQEFKRSIVKRARLIDSSILNTFPFTKSLEIDSFLELMDCKKQRRAETRGFKSTRVYNYPLY